MQRLRVGGLGVLFVHEVHKVRGRAEDAFEAAFREGWMPTLGACDEDRLLWEAKLLVPLGWSPRQDVDFDEVPVDGREHELTLYMEDTVWPYEDKFGEYIDRCGEVSSKSWDRPNPLLTIEAAFAPALGSHVRREVTLMQRIHDPDALLKLLQTEIAPEHRAPGTWMHDALELRDQWTSRLLRTSSWSPLH